MIMRLPVFSFFHFCFTYYYLSCRKLFQTFGRSYDLKLFTAFKKNIFLTLFRMGFFGAAHGRGQGPPSLKSVTHILQWWNLSQLYLTKNDPKNIWITWHTPWVPMTPTIFHWKSANFAISRNTCIDCILIQNF